MKTLSRKCIVITAPSGAGKTTIVQHLLRSYPDQLGFSVSATTRKQRANEADGEDYYFIDPQEFKDKIAAGEFVEHEEVYPNQFYGTLHSEMERLWKMGRTILFDIDVQGAQVIKKALKENCLAVFVKPPDEKTLMERLQNRKTESESALRVRLEKVKEEMSYENCFDEILVNDILQITLQEAEAMTEKFLGIVKEQ